MKTKKRKKSKEPKKSKDVIYISGGITGLRNYVRSFAIPTAKFRKQGYTVINPVELDHQFFPQCIFFAFKWFFKIIGVETDWLPYIIRDIIVAFRGKVNVIYMLPNWKTSTGAKIEKIIMKEKLGAKVKYIRK